MAARDFKILVEIGIPQRPASHVLHTNGAPTCFYPAPPGPSG